MPDLNPYGYGTASIDCLMQLSGEPVFVLEDTEIRLYAGDWLIVNGVPNSRHSAAEMLVRVVVRPADSDLPHHPPGRVPVWCRRSLVGPAGGITQPGV